MALINVLPCIVVLLLCAPFNALEDTNFLQVQGTTTSSELNIDSRALQSYTYTYSGGYGSSSGSYDSSGYDSSSYDSSGYDSSASAYGGYGASAQEITLGSSKSFTVDSDNSAAFVYKVPGASLPLDLTISVSGAPVTAGWVTGNGAYEEFPISAGSTYKGTIPAAALKNAKGLIIAVDGSGSVTAKGTVEIKTSTKAIIIIVVCTVGGVLLLGGAITAIVLLSRKKKNKITYPSAKVDTTPQQPQYAAQTYQQQPYGVAAQQPAYYYAQPQPGQAYPQESPVIQGGSPARVNNVRKSTVTNG